MPIKRKKTRIVKVGKVFIGGDAPISVQSMVKVKTSQVNRVIDEINSLEDAGCDILRLAIKDKSDAIAIKRIKRKVGASLVADIHFDYRLALASIESGVDKVRLNPGNIYKKDEVYQVVRELKFAKLPLRIGVNSGSVKEDNSSIPERLVKSALAYIKMVEGFNFHDIIISLKASSVEDTLIAYRKISKLCDYPLHLGVTATGSFYSGLVKSAIALGTLLLEGIGDTIRVSLTDKPLREVYVAKEILKSLSLRSYGPEIISCPTCGRCEVNLIKLVNEFEEKVFKLKTKPLKIALMGCVVNGPGEAREADLGIAFGRKEGLIFKKGKATKKIEFSKSIEYLLREVKNRR
jgi:(E)-4-hydroxy-3-methylbut-2-enyl-diphosphate synthase